MSVRPLLATGFRGRRRTAIEWLTATALAGVCLAFQVSTSHLASPLDAPAPAWRSAASSLGPARSWAAPLLGTPFGAGLQPRVALGRLVLSLTGRPGLRVAAACLAVLFAFVLALAMVRMGSHRLPAIAVPLTILYAGVFRNPPAAGFGFAFQGLLAALVLLLVVGCAERPDLRRAAALVLVLALAVDGDPSWLALAVAAWLALRATVRTGQRPRRALRLAGSAAVLAAAAHALVTTAMTMAGMPAAPGVARLTAGVADVAVAAFLGPHWTPAQPVDAAAAALSAAWGGWSGVFGLTGAVLAVAGGMASWRAGRRTTGAVVAAFLAAGFALVAVRARVDSAPGLLLLLVGGGALAALGGTWLLRQATQRSSALVAGAIIVSIPLTSLSSARPRALDGPAGDAYAAAIASLADGRTAFVAESAPFDELVLGLPGDRDAGGRVTRIPRDAATVGRFVRAGYSVFAFQAARDQLASEGVPFTRRPLVHATLGRYFDTQPAGAIAAVAAAGDLGEAIRHSPIPFADRLGAPRLTRASARLALCLAGRVGSPSGALEARATSAALDVSAGEPVGTTSGRSPVTIALTADDRVAIVRVAHRGTVRAESGVAIAIIDQAGDLVDRTVVDASTGFQLRVPYETLAVYQVGGPGAGAGLRPAPQDRLLFESPDQRIANLDVGALDDPTFGAGWHLPENDDGTAFRWMADQARLVVRVERPTVVRLVVEASPAEGPEPIELAAEVNGVAAGVKLMAAGLSRYEWAVPIEAWRAGLNEVLLRASRTVQGTTDPRVRGASVRLVRFERPAHQR